MTKKIHPIEWDGKVWMASDGIKYRLERGQSIKQIVETPKHPGTQRAEPKPPKKQKPGRWVPRHTAEDLARCRKCRWSERDSNIVACMYLANHRPPERRGCEPGKNCKRFERKTAESERKKREGIVS